jgi:arylsulfatase A-like enzyme
MTGLISERDTTADGLGERPATMPNRRRPGPLDVFVLSSWCGLAGGCLEVLTRIICKHAASHQMYAMSRHFVWMAPLCNLLLFSAFGLLLALATKLWPRRGGWISSRLVGFAASLPALLWISPRLYLWASAILASGISARLGAIVERRPDEVRRRLALTVPVLLGIALASASVLLGGDHVKAWREASRPLPPGDPPNVLLIVLDTVRADHLSLYGYRRPTSPALQRLAERAIRFDEARATAPWTLPSHASLFTGRWPHEMDLDWQTPMGAEFPTLAEYLGSRGFATAGFVANVHYCSHEFGLDRGFTHYEDYVLGTLGPLRTCLMGDLSLKAVAYVGRMLSAALPGSRLLPGRHSTFWRDLAVEPPKRYAPSINRAFLDWLSRRNEPARPFFAFLNYFDAHTHYLLPEGTPYRFGQPPRTEADVQALADWATLDKLHLPRYYKTLAEDCYDSCLAYLDEQLGELFGELKRRRVLDRTVVIVTADHGEGLGEHDLFFHGESLYRTEIHVPLLIAPPGQVRPAVVGETASLRDLPATIADLTGQATGAPFPGRSLAGLWRDPRPGGRGADCEGAISELVRPNPQDPNQGRSPAHRGSLTALAEGDYVYIRNDGDGSEELFDERRDPQESDNRARFESARAIKERLRARLEQMRDGRPSVSQ